MNARRLILVIMILFARIATAATLAPHVETSFDDGWRFARGDIEGAETSSFDDSAWQRVTVPHDWSIGGPFDERALAGGAGAFLPTGIGWYRKHFTLPQARAGRRVFIEFDGVMAKSGVWINGVHLDYRPYGYASFRYELTPHLRFNGAENVLAVRADTQMQPASRWYAGSGIYRHVRLIETNDLHVTPWGTFVSVSNATRERARLRIESEVIDQSSTPVDAHLQVSIIDPQDREVLELASPAMHVPPGDAQILVAESVFDRPELWDVDHPVLYRARVRVVADDGAALDEEMVSFGIRDARFDAAQGFLLNGRPLKIKGVALHADGGAFGMAVPLAFWERRLTTLRQLGVNAIRTAHHPFSPEVLTLCDRMGLLVLDETFDMWTVGKNPYDYHLYFSDWGAIDARDFVRRDRNHPSVILWSAGNEIHDATYPLIAKPILGRLLSLFHANDPTRSVTMALFRPSYNGDYHNGLADMLDVVGQNYRENELLAAHRDNPARKILGTENSKNHESWLPVRDNAAYAGMFLWTGADYLGEADRTGWPAIGNPSGLLDRTDRLKPVGMERASWWSEEPVLYIARRVTQEFDNSAVPTTPAVAIPAPQGPGALADWTPVRREPHAETIEIYSNAPDVELFLSGRPLSKQALHSDDPPRIWQVQFTSGELRAVGYRGGKRIVERTLRTAGAATRVQLIPESTTLAPGFDRIAFVRVEIVDARGTVVPGASDLLHVQVTGPGALAAFDNGSNTDHTPFASADRHASKGHALIMLRATGAAGTIRVAAEARGLTTGTATVQALASTP